MSPDEFQRELRLAKLRLIANKPTSSTKPKPAKSKAVASPKGKAKGTSLALGIAGGARSEFAKKVAGRLRATLADAGVSKHPEMWRAAIADWQKQTAKMEAKFARLAAKSK